MESTIVESLKFDHIGWITPDIDKFEKFWCSVLGFRCVGESTLTKEMATNLFDIDSEAAIKRYKLNDMVVEIHIFDRPSEASQKFDRYGINHMCLFVSDRSKFLEAMPTDVTKHIYNNPGGWQNIFIQDYEGNWIELRESFKK